jgi:hypothetical protein
MSRREKLFAARAAPYCIESLVAFPGDASDMTLGTARRSAIRAALLLLGLLAPADVAPLVGPSFLGITSNALPWRRVSLQLARHNTSRSGGV